MVVDEDGADPGLARLRELVGRGDVAAARSALSQASPDERDAWVGALADGERAPRWLEDWRARFPTCAVGATLSGLTSVARAAALRGAGRAADVPPAAWAPFERAMREADAELSRACELDARDPTPWSFRITCAMTLDAPPADRKRLFDEAVRRHPPHYGAHVRFLQATAAKWGGSHDAMFAFARESAARLPEGALARVVVPKAHLERWLFDAARGGGAPIGAALDQPAVRAEIRAAWMRSLGGAAPAPAVRLFHARNDFAFALWQCGDRERAAKELGALGGRISASPWRYAGKPEEAFAAAHRACG